MFRSLRFVFTLAACAVLAQQAVAQESKAAKATRQKVKQKITVEFKDIGTADVFKDIKGEMDKPVNFKIDNANGLSNNTKLTYKAKDKTVEQILNELSDKFEFGWIVVSNPSNNKIDGWIIIRKTGKKERGYEEGKEPKKSSSLPHSAYELILASRERERPEWRGRLFTVPPVAYAPGSPRIKELP